MSDQELLFDPDEQEVNLGVLNRTRTVEAVEQGQPFYTIDGDLNPILAGYTQLVDFDQGKAKGLIFIAPDNKTYSLGQPSRRQTRHNVVHHYEMIHPVVERGFELQNLVHTRGGSDCFALLRHPEITMPHQLSWDHEVYENPWDGNSAGDDGLMYLSIALWLSPKTGKSLRAAVGFFRQICSNGLVSSILGLGQLRWQHNQFTRPKMDQFADDTLNALDSYELKSFTPRVLDWPLRLLDAYQRDPEQTTAMLPAFARAPFNTAIASQPNWYQDSLAYQMNLALESQQDLTTLDVLNMLTNVNNEAENDNLYMRIEPLSEAFLRLLEVAAFKQGIEFPADMIVDVNQR